MSWRSVSRARTARWVPTPRRSCHRPRHPAELVVVPLEGLGAAGVDLFGISNWVRTLRSIPPWWESFRNALYAELGDPNGPDSVRLYRISPLFHADEIRKPLLVLQGANDPRVLRPESDQIVEAVRRRGGVAEYVVFPDEGHGFIKKENNMRAYRTALEFLDKYVKAPVSVP